MRPLRIAGFVLVLGLAWPVLAWLLGRPTPVVFVGGPILTMDREGRIVEALAVQGERIAAVGPEENLRRWAEDVGARVVDLEGRALLPGFIEAHGHFPGDGIYAVVADLNSPPIGSVETLDDLVARLAEHAADVSAGDWVVGNGYDDTLLAEKRHPTRVDLDRASASQPVAALHVSGHLAVVNSAGLERLGITRDSPDPEGGRIRRDAAGEPDGVLEETAAEPVAALLAPGPIGALRVLASATERYLSNGVTTAQSGATPLELLAPFRWIDRLGMLDLRLVVWPLGEAADVLYEKGVRWGSWGGPHARLGAVKLIADGSIQGYTGYLSQPYYVPPGDDPTYRGYPRIGREALFEQVARHHARGRQLAIHGNGDAAIDDILDALEAAQRDHPRKDARPVLVHAQMARPDQLDRMKRLGVIPSFFSLHTFYWGDRHREIFMGPERAARMSPARSAQERGLRFTIHADAPVVPMEPLRLVWSAVNRKTRSGKVVGPAERIDAMQALRAVTIDAAYEMFLENEVGSLEPGKLADLVILSRNPLDDPETIDQIRVVETILGGETVWRAPD